MKQYFKNKRLESKNRAKRTGVKGLLDSSSLGVFSLLAFATNHMILVSSLGGMGYYMQEYITTKPGIEFLNEIRDNLTNEEYKNSIAMCALSKGVSVSSPTAMQSCTHAQVAKRGGETLKGDQGYTGEYGAGIASKECAKLDKDKCIENMSKGLEKPKP